MQEAAFDGQLDRILGFMPEPPYLHQEDPENEFRLRPPVDAELKRLHRNLRILTLGGYAGDVLGTFRKLIAFAEAKRFKEALEEIYALRSRASTYHGQIEFKGYWFPLFDMPITEITHCLYCGLGDELLTQLDSLSSIDPHEEPKGLRTILGVCADWVSKHGNRAEQFSSYVERLSRKMKTRPF